MSVIEARNLEDSAPTISARTATDEARAALWTGIIGAAKHLGKREPLPAARRPTVVQLKQGSAATPVYFIGAGLFEFHIAQLMSSAHPVFAVEIAWPAEWHDAATRGDVHGCPHLPHMVAPYVAALHAHAGATPCVIMGYSFHGSMAFEAAHQLAERGGNVDMVILLDAPAQYPAAPQVAWQKLREVWKRTARPIASDRTSPSLLSRLQSTGSILQWTFYEAAKTLKGRLLHWAIRDPGKLTIKLDTLGRPLHWQLIERVYANSLRSYELHPLDCRGAVFRADRADDCPGGDVDDSLGWGNLFRKGLQVVQVTGNHISMMRQPPHDHGLARDISDLLDRFCATPPQRDLQPDAAIGAATASSR
jgi:thioesterase domain-containing protein